MRRMIQLRPSMAGMKVMYWPTWRRAGRYCGDSTILCLRAMSLALGVSASGAAGMMGSSLR